MTKQIISIMLCVVMLFSLSITTYSTDADLISNNIGEAVSSYLPKAPVQQRGNIESVTANDTESVPPVINSRDDAFESDNAGVIDLPTLFNTSPFALNPDGSVSFILEYMYDNESGYTGFFFYNDVEGKYNAFLDDGGTTIDDICLTMESALSVAYMMCADLLSTYGLPTRDVTVHLWETYYVADGGEYWGQATMDATMRPGYSAVHTHIHRNTVFEYDKQYYFDKYPTVTQYYGEMIHIHTDYNKHLYADSYISIDNVSSFITDDQYKDTAVAVVIDDGGLFLMYGCTLTDTTVNLADPSTFKGTGVLLTTKKQKTYPIVELDGGAVELWATTSISGFNMGIDSDYGVTRVKDGTWNISNNNISVNLAYGTYIGKWCDNLNSANIMKVYLEDVGKWSSGDIVLASGYKDINGISVKTPVFPSDLNYVSFQNSEGFAYALGLEYNYGGNTDPYPVIRFVMSTVYNVRLATWYTTLYDAVAASAANDTLVFYGNTNESSTIIIPHNLTIRSSYEGEQSRPSAGAAMIVDSRAGSDCTAYWSAAFINGINVTNTAAVEFAPSDDLNHNYGTLTFDANNACRVLENSGISHLNGNLTMQDGLLVYGGAICNYGILNIKGATIKNCSALVNGQANRNGGAIGNSGIINFTSGTIQNCSADNGGAIYNNGGNVNISGGSVIDCTADKGSVIFQVGTFNLSGTVTFKGSKNEDVYLPTEATRDIADGVFVITKAGDFNFTDGAVKVTLGNADINLYDSRNVVESGAVDVTSDDLRLFTLTNLNGYDTEYFETLDFVYTASDVTPTKEGMKVLELDVKLLIKLGSLTIKKQGADPKDESQAFVFRITGIDGTDTQGVDLTVVVYGNSEITINDLRVGNYNVVEQSDWSWRYDTVTVSLNNAAAINAKSLTAPVVYNDTTLVTYTNKRTTPNWLNGCSYAINKFLDD